MVLNTYLKKLGDGVLLYVLDSCIDFENNPSLTDCYFPSSDDNACKAYFAAVNLDHFQKQSLNLTTLSGVELLQQKFKTFNTWTWKDHVHGTKERNLLVRIGSMF